MRRPGEGKTPPISQIRACVVMAGCACALVLIISAAVLATFGADPGGCGRAVLVTAAATCAALICLERADDSREGEDRHGEDRP